MDYGGTDRRRTKKDLKRKRLVRVYKRGGQHRGIELKKEENEETKEETKKGKRKKKNNKRKK
jgi:hypothetical protein